MEEKFASCLVVLLLVSAIFLIVLSGFNATPWGRYVVNQWDYAVQKIDDATSYETRKNVEDTCRAMIASYQADRLTHEQYKNAESTEQRSWADQAMMRANKTATTYNEYILKNSFVWSGNIPADIKNTLPFIDTEASK